ncbi:hypothetical protein MKW98_029090 [Papaver atlanticum]|uniref:Uncharacterized protein n=1 Tax=Papaver atlanticum TaxID=357466 RepID=A0AAD4X9V3_9MAGN|nr:hypothetical protein MKW98_029090 [Papaver atlanticum]
MEFREWQPCCFELGNELNPAFPCLRWCSSRFDQTGRTERHEPPSEVLEESPQSSTDMLLKVLLNRTVMINFSILKARQNKRKSRLKKLEQCSLAGTF